ncbi:MAG: cysteine--tRNA ligase [Bacteroidales bacterium]|jgi:cysteinyl-tRNA synthetase|nr:cysteine--tRNA ligase [Bacteroidales bacterium]
MDHPLSVYNSLTRSREQFIPLNAPHVGLYVCGPTVYGDAHLGHARPAITFDLLFRYLSFLGYKVRYVRNITDVGHLENDADAGEDKIAKKARLEQVEPMEIVQYFTLRYHHNMEQLNVLPPSIEPRASGHILEQMQLIQKILDAGYAYESNGSVYFDLEKYAKKYPYGQLSGRVLDDLTSQTRDLDGQDEKRFPLDFALWKKASSKHIMRWSSPWSEGFPGWHLECTAMSTKYLGETFDIHGGGMDLLFPHHECEIAQSTASLGHESVRYWLHNNMITINGQKMGKSLGNFITLNDSFAGTHPLLQKAYSPMTVRFFILQAHYRSTVDFSNEALQASEKGLQRLLEGISVLDKLTPAANSTISISGIEEKCLQAMNDDLNSPMVIAHLFDGLRIIHLVNDGKETLSESDLQQLQKVYHQFAWDILGLKEEQTSDRMELISGLVNYILDRRMEAKAEKNFAASDRIRDMLKELGVEVKDRKDGFDWKLEN